MLLPFLCLRYIQSPTASGHYQEVWPCGQSAERRWLMTVSHAHHFETSASWPPNPHSVFPLSPVGWDSSRPLHGWEDWGWEGSVAGPRSHRVLPIPCSRPTSATCRALSWQQQQRRPPGTVLHALHAAPPFLRLMLNGTFFFFHCKSSVLLGTSWRKLRDAKKNLIISPAHFPKSLQDMQKINIKCEVCVHTILFVHRNTCRCIYMEDYCLLPRSQTWLLISAAGFPHKIPSTALRKDRNPMNSGF